MIVNRRLHSYVFHFHLLFAAILAYIFKYWSFTNISLENTFTLNCRLELAHLWLYWVFQFWKKVILRLLRVLNCARAWRSGAIYSFFWKYKLLKKSILLWSLPLCTLVWKLHTNISIPNWCEHFANLRE